jgi:hypothetical protein
VNYLMLHVTLPRNSMRRVRLRSSIEKSSTECGWKVHWNNEENFKDTELPVLELSDNQKEKIGVLLQLQRSAPSHLPRAYARRPLAMSNGRLVVGIGRGIGPLAVYLSGREFESRY